MKRRGFFGALAGMVAAPIAAKAAAEIAEHVPQPAPAPVAAEVYRGDVQFSAYNSFDDATCCSSGGDYQQKDIVFKRVTIG